MSVIHDVLKDEHNRLISLLDFYQKKISEYPRGSMQVKKRGSQFYCYQVFRDHEHVKSIYIGKKDSEKSRDFNSMIEKRRRYEQKLKEARNKLAEVEKLLRVAA